jgi:hypothetical protein
MKKEWLQYVFAYVMWIVALLLGVWFLLTSRVWVRSALTLYYAGDSITRKMQVGLLDQVYFVIVGLAWLIMMIVSEQYFRKGIHRKDLLHRVSTIIAPELLLIALSDIFLMVVLGIYQQSWLFWLRLSVELIAGGMLFRLAILTPSKKTLTHS